MKWVLSGRKVKGKVHGSMQHKIGGITLPWGKD